jgi:ubiquinone/menaquinone biosynthesis C-methylase UbiE/uncharacterized protein YbaR (Trm112 family)
MKPICKHILCCPHCLGSLKFNGSMEKEEFQSGLLTCSKCGRRYPVTDGMINFVLPGEEQRFSKRFELMRSLYNSFYTPLTNLMFVPCGGYRKARHEVLDRLEIKPGCQVLETGIGTGDNLPFLNGYMRRCGYVGIDIQQRMLNTCIRNLDRYQVKAGLMVANAERLPFRDQSFDVVFHLGAINLFTDKRRAILEMIRVARKGSRIVIADETEKAARLLNLFVGTREPIVPPLDLIPETMHEIRLETIWNGYGYLIEFRVP